MQVGDVVVLRGGSPKMTIKKIEGDSAEVEWKVGELEFEDTFSLTRFDLISGDGPG
jgi:uncharacterized protein YodC (DUF2158 family)